MRSWFSVFARYELVNVVSSSVQVPFLEKKERNKIIVISRDEGERLAMWRLDGCGRVHFPFIQFTVGSLEISNVKGS